MPVRRHSISLTKSGPVPAVLSARRRDEITFINNMNIDTKVILHKPTGVNPANDFKLEPGESETRHMRSNAAKKSHEYSYDTGNVKRDPRTGTIDVD